MTKLFGGLVVLLAACGILPTIAAAHSTASCPRPAAGSVAAQPPSLYSKGGVLNVYFKYYTTVDAAGRTLFCFVTPDGLEVADFVPSSRRYA